MMDDALEALPHAHPELEDSSSQKTPDLSHKHDTSRPSTYAFLNHSTDTVTHNLPPNVDDKPLARQRRRRTSPEDQTILEAAYVRDPKPDKTARLDLVKQVSLGEKEVQIWFQNRRQSSRRKSRPLLPHEIAQYQSSRSGTAPPFSSSDPAVSSSQDEATQASAGVATELEHANQTQGIVSAETATSPTGSALSSPELPVIATSTKDGVQEQSASDQIVSREMHPPRPLYQSIGRVGDTSIGRSTPCLRRSQSLSNHLPLTHVGHANSAGRLEKASSFVRISMNSEGNAKIVTKDTSSPSPPRALQGVPLVGHDTGYGLADQAPNVLPMKSLQRSSSGRSRDSRVWEFWCDKDARSDLEDKAEKDASGSAADAIGLLRSASGRSILGPIPSKRNSAMSRQYAPSKRSKLDLAMPKLHKSSTALGRLEGKLDLSATVYGKPTQKLMYSESAYIPGNESDKENWSPSDIVSHDVQSEQSLPFGHRSKYPHKSSEDLARHSTDETFKTLRASISDAQRNQDEEDPEVAEFMRGDRKRSNISGTEELDCVQGLLSLSQGNWR